MIVTPSPMATQSTSKPAAVTPTGIGNLLTTCTPNNDNICTTINRNIDMTDITMTVKSAQPISVISSGTTCSTST